MIKQSWMVIVAGGDLVDELEREQKVACEWTEYGYNSTQLCDLQRKQAARGVCGCEIVSSNYGYSVRSDSGLQDFALLASSRSKELDGTLEDAERWAKEWCSREPSKRYAWRRLPREGRAA